MSVRSRARRARILRRDSTDAETRLWRALREANLPFKVRRQHPIGVHIADFAIPASKLAIEIDGGQHASNAPADALRTKQMGLHGYRVIRFWNNEVMENTDGVVAIVVAEIEKTPTSP